MTDKEVILNGIDVSECEHRYAKECMTVWASGGSHTLHKVLCHNSPNCYFKQSKRKEKECEKYEQALNEIEKYLDAQQKYFDGEDYHNLLDIINKVRGKINDRQNKS